MKNTIEINKFVDKNTNEMRIKKTLIISFLLLSNFILAQKTDIIIYPNNIAERSAVNIIVKEKGTYVLKITDKSKTILYEKKLVIDKKDGFKHNFSKYKIGEYNFSLYKNNEIIFNKVFKKIDKHEEK
ncbi:hypothetical protein LPB136_05850 [Tenacibaculum todarodis]|uniref:Secretion protein n=1 Tax=Tenacibaculum todarodis TaxID=1850252 RepID=A0A1L3JIE2_9FLAO|nr:hypothetical protein [Tenacibaculum todarodis]APG64910.1 hypothetical protein LPB136_05850 [Tenacibaculum todarodis]